MFAPSGIKHHNYDFFSQGYCTGLATVHFLVRSVIFKGETILTSLESRLQKKKVFVSPLLMLKSKFFLLKIILSIN